MIPSWSATPSSPRSTSRTIDNIASYYASLSPAQSEIAKNAPARPVPALVRAAAPADGLSVGGIISYRKNDPGRTAEQNNAICLTCHERGERTLWQGSVHETRGLACTDCHTIMKSVSAQHQLKTAFEPDTCFQCHKDRRAQMFRSSHMPLREGKLVCTDCHNPHGSATEAMLRQDSINDNCYKCHAEKRGPFLFEHAPVRENCLNCHDPHGSINEHSLKMSVPRLCYECHTIGHTQVRTKLAIHHGPGVPELPYQHSWQQQSRRRQFSSDEVRRNRPSGKASIRIGVEGQGQCQIERKKFEPAWPEQA